MNEQDSISLKKLQKKCVSRRNLIRGAAGTGAGLMLSSGLRLPAFAQEAAQQTRGELPRPPDSISNPSPTISSLCLSCAPQGKQAPNPLANGGLLVNGQNFVVNSVVRWNGNNRPTTFHSSNKLTAQILASDIATIGTAVVTVFNPAPGGRGSNSLTFNTTPTGKFEEG
jgi:hypothetical protein